MQSHKVVTPLIKIQITKRRIILRWESESYKDSRPMRAIGAVRAEVTLCLVGTLRDEGTRRDIGTVRAIGTVGTLGTVRAVGKLFSDVITEESSVWVCPLNDERGFVANTFSWESEGDDPRCRSVIINIGNKDERKKPPTNVVRGRHCLWEKPVFPLDNYLVFPIR